MWDTIPTLSPVLQKPWPPQFEFANFQRGVMSYKQWSSSYLFISHQLGLITDLKLITQDVKLLLEFIYEEFMSGIIVKKNIERKKNHLKISLQKKFQKIVQISPFNLNKSFNSLRGNAYVSVPILWLILTVVQDETEKFRLLTKLFPDLYPFMDRIVSLAEVELTVSKKLKI